MEKVDRQPTPVLAFKNPVLGMKTSIFAKTA
jgi:hypothetical protein